MNRYLVRVVAIMSTTAVVIVSYVRDPDAMILPFYCLLGVILVCLVIP